MLATMQANIITHTTTLVVYTYYPPTANAALSSLTTMTQPIPTVFTTETAIQQTTTKQDTITTTIPTPALTTYAKTTTKADNQPLPAWVFPATATLLLYDLFTISGFAWCWVMGWFWWWKRRNERSRGSRTLGWVGEREREAVVRQIVDWRVEREMRRLGMV